MSKTNNALVFYRSYYEAVRDLEEQDRQIMYAVIFEYCFDGIIPELSGHLKGYWKLIKPTIDSSQSRYNASKSNGSKGGRPKSKPIDNQNETKKEPKNNPEQTYTKPIQNLNKDKDIELDRERERSKEEAELIPEKFNRFYNRYLEGSNHPNTTATRTYCEREWLKLTDEEMDKAVLVAFDAAKSFYMKYGNDGEDMRFVKTPYKFLEEKLFNDFEEKKPLIVHTSDNGVCFYTEHGKPTKMYKQDLVYFDKERKAWFPI